MSRSLFIRVRDPGMVPGLIHEMIRDGVAPERLRLYGRRPPKGMAIERIRWRTAGMALVEGGLLGAGLVLVPLLVADGLDAAAGIVLLGLGASVGAGWWLQHSRRVVAPVEPQRQALRDGELVIAADLEADQVGPVERRLSARHPQLLVLGSDAAGSPPFP